MAKSKFTASIVITVEHPNGTKVTKKAVKGHIERLFIRDHVALGGIIKVRVRDVDTD